MHVAMLEKQFSWIGDVLASNIVAMVQAFFPLRKGPHLLMRLPLPPVSTRVALVHARRGMRGYLRFDASDLVVCQRDWALQVENVRKGPFLKRLLIWTHLLLVQPERPWGTRLRELELQRAVDSVDGQPLDRLP